MPTLRSIVLAALRADAYLSTREIRTKIFEQNNTTVDVRTIIKCIDELKQLHHNITETTERRGKFNLPVKVFRLESILNIQPSISNPQ